MSENLLVSVQKIAFTIPGGTEINPARGMPIGKSTGALSETANIVRWGTTTLVIVTIILAIYFLIWGGILWISSAGDKAKIEAARKKITFAIIGLVFVFLSFMIINVIGDFFGINFGLFSGNP